MIRWPELEAVLWEWQQRAERDRIFVSDQLIFEKAAFAWPLIYPDKPVPKFSNNWLHGFKMRNGLKVRTAHEKLLSAPDSVVVKLEMGRGSNQGFEISS